MTPPLVEDVTKGCDGLELSITGDGRCILKSTGEMVEAMYDAVRRSDSGLSDGVVADFDRVWNDDGLSFGVDGFLAAVVFERHTGAEAMFATKIPWFAGTRFFVDDDWASKRNNGSGVIVEGAIEVLPRRDGRV
jgi:hypothetical protein